MRVSLMFVWLVIFMLAWSSACAVGQGYLQSNLVSDGTIPAAHTDPNLINAWGIAFNPTSVVWVADNGTGVATLYDGNGTPQSLVVTIPPPAGSADQSKPTGVVFSGSATDFIVNSGGASSPARFIFATEDGTISGWDPTVPPPPVSTQAIREVDNSATGAIYKGLALAQSRLYATDFHNNRIDVFNNSFAPIALGGSFQDPNLPAGFAPFGIREIGGNIFVTYAMQDADAEDDVAGAGLGYVDVFDPDGNLIKRLVSDGVLDAPWGLALAPGNFGAFSNALLVGNFGDGSINAFNPTTGAFLGSLADPEGNPIVIDGLWGITFGNGLPTQPTNTLFFAAGPDDENHGLYGRLDPVPEPASISLALMGLSAFLWRRRR